MSCYSISLSSWNSRQRYLLLDVIKKRHISTSGIIDQTIPSINQNTSTQKNNKIMNNHYPRSSLLPTIPINQYSTSTKTLMSYKNNRPYKCTTHHNPRKKKETLKIIPVSTQIDILSKKKRTYENAKLIDSILKQIVRQERHDFQHQKINPEEMELKLKSTTGLYMQVLQSWGKCHHDQAPIKAEEVLRHMFNRHLFYSQNLDVELSPLSTIPTSHHFMEVLNAWMVSGRYGYEQRCEELVRWMEMWYNASKGDASCEVLMPNTDIFNMLIKVWSSSQLEDAAFRAEDVLRRMGKLHQSGNTKVMPNISSFHSTIRAWSKSNQPKKAYKAQELLTLMESFFLKQSLKPNKHIYMTVLQTWIQTCKENKDPALPYYIDYIIKRMIYLYTNHDIIELKPNVMIYNFGLYAWSLSNLVEAPKNATTLFQSMNKYCKPNTKSYTLLLKTWAKHCHTNKDTAHEVYKLLNQLEEQKTHGRLNMQHFQIAFSTLLYTKFSKTREERNDVLRITFQTYRLLLQNKNVKPTTQIYYKIMQICCKLVEKEDYLCKILSSLLLHILEHEKNGDGVDVDSIWLLLEKNLSEGRYKELCDFYAMKEKKL